MSAELSHKVSFFELVFIGLVLFMSTFPWGFLMLRSSSNEIAYFEGLQSDLFLRLFWRTVDLILIVLFIRHHRELTRLALKRPFLLCFAGIIVLSTTWSAAPALTLHGLVPFVCNLFFALYVTSRIEPGLQYRLLKVMFGILVVLNYLLVLALPQLAISGQGYWTGIFSHRNVLGNTMLWAAVVFGVELVRRKPVHIVFFIAAAALVIFSRSATAFIGLIAMPLTIFFIVVLPRRGRWEFFFGALIVSALLIYFFLVPHLDTLFALLKRDATLTGRTTFWKILFGLASERLWTGYGFAAFWRPGNEAFEYVVNLEKHLIGAHNSALDICLQVGVFGLLSFVLCGIVALRDALYCFFKKRTISTLFFTSFIIVLTISSFSESFLFGTNSFPLLIFLIILYSTQKERERLDSEASN